jgi:hypothetical protein
MLLLCYLYAITSQTLCNCGHWIASQSLSSRIFIVTPTPRKRDEVILQPLFASQSHSHRSAIVLQSLCNRHTIAIQSHALQSVMYDRISSHLNRISKVLQSLCNPIRSHRNRTTIVIRSDLNRISIAFQSLCIRIVVVSQSLCNHTLKSYLNRISIVLQLLCNCHTIVSRSHLNCIAYCNRRTIGSIAL